MARDLSRPHDDVVRITTAARSREEEISARQRRYLFSMGLRTVCFVAAIVVDGWLRWVLVVAALILPYVAVVMANNSGTKSDAFTLNDGDYHRPVLNSATNSDPNSANDSI